MGVAHGVPSSRPRADIVERSSSTSSLRTRGRGEAARRGCRARRAPAWPPSRSSPPCTRCMTTSTSGSEPPVASRGRRRGRREPRRPTIAAYSRPATWPTTETTPAAPCVSQARLSVVVAGVDREPGLLHQPDAASQVPDRVLDRDDRARARRPAGRCPSAILMPRAPRDVVEHHREVAGAGDRAEVREHAVLGGLVVVRRDDAAPRRAPSFAACSASSTE